MSCTKFADLDQTNPNYQFLVDAMSDGTVALNEDECKALIKQSGIALKFPLGMSAYLESQGYEAHLISLPEA